MLANRSIPRATVIPELAYPDIGVAADWLCRAFGFTVRLRIGGHRIQINVGDGAVVLTEFGGGDGQIAIHGTNDPSGIGKDVSHGCVRVLNEVIEQVSKLPLGTPVYIT